ncbi:GSCOCG00013549001-RA-CDS [Cotesia congregata]|uniref:Similar to CG4928: UNC93-like protein (Drosophila melanogaster) n=1 Tax=Cotesia congregata TaxID=51543 RepID=A0A8J2E9V2_COTCN|nr:GSCOCG00013549001-RA-CDS [Cotesia congregata]CAG5074380.1 Similar to CG4928: UNC93-like protein (Drosophila melanogaster) [Cotesia congregata]
MGSLPNLHELSRDKENPPIVHRPSPIGGFGPIKLPPQPPPLAQTNRRVKSSSGHHHTLWDNDVMLEHMTTYSPISCRSARASALSCRRRESMTSSATGTSSVRRLIAAVRASTPSAASGNNIYSTGYLGCNIQPRPSRKLVIRHCAALFLGHMTISAATLPLLPLQAGLGAFNSHLGPILLAVLYGIATITSMLSTVVIQKLGTNIVICLSHFVTILFLVTHLYPKWYVLLASYALYGMTLSPWLLSRTSHVNICASNLSVIYATDPDDPDDPDDTKRECILRRLNRILKLAEDLGLAVGCLIAGLIIKVINPLTKALDSSDLEDVGSTCGAEYCPQETYFYNQTLLLPTMAVDTAKVILSVYLGLGALAFGISCGFLDSRLREPQSSLDHQSVRQHLKSLKQSFQDPKLQLAAPLTLFIGLEQGFIYSDFTEAFVVCALDGAGPVIISFLTFALLQALAGVTLSMLMRHIRRHFVVAVGFAFHACLLLALVTWRPAGDDPALFNVISAAWGVCNAIWETLILTLLLGLYPSSWQAPLSTSIFWKYLGLFLALGLHGVVCTRLRVLGLGTSLILAVVPYIWLELRLARRGKCLVTTSSS